jgi:hypothetical protein
LISVGNSFAAKSFDVDDVDEGMGDGVDEFVVDDV